MTKDEIIASLLDQADDKDSLADDKDTDDIFAQDAKVLREAAEMLKSLQAELEGVKQERDTWKRLCEAAEYDLHRAIMDTASACDICKYSGQEETPCGVCNCVSHWHWRGPCAESGGVENA